MRTAQLVACRAPAALLGRASRIGWNGLHREQDVRFARLSLKVTEPYSFITTNQAVVAAVATVMSVLCCCIMAICIWRVRKRHEVPAGRCARATQHPYWGSALSVQLQMQQLKRQTANIIAASPRIDMEGARGATAVTDVCARACCLARLFRS
jgi:hypothetical protein